MPELRIEREHALGLAAARQVADDWMAAASRDYGLSCVKESDDGCDRIAFSRSGVSGQVRVTANRFELDAKLGFLLGAFKDRIEAEISRNLDQLLANGRGAA